jgi:DHA3 family tetracycline resistance protein-like MFS transporter
VSPAARVYLIAIVGWDGLFAAWATAAVVRRVTTIGLDPLELVLVGTALELSAFVGEIPTGVVADLYSRRISVAIGYALVGLGFLAETLATGFGSIVLAQVVWGGGWTFVSGAREAWIADEIGEADAARLYLRASQWGQAATLAGIGASVGLAGWTLETPMWISSLLFVALAGWLAVNMREPGFRPVPRESLSTWSAFGQTLARGVGTVRARPALITLLAVAVLAGTASEAMDRLREIHLIQELRLPEVAGLGPVHWIGGLNAAALLVGLALVAWLRTVVDPARVNLLPRLLTAAYGLLALAALGFALTQSFALAFFFWCVFASVRRACEPFITAWLNHRLDPSVRATVLSLHGQSGALGEMVGGPLLGGLARALGIRAALTAAAAVLLPVIGLFAREGRRKPRA